MRRQGSRLNGVSTNKVKKEVVQHGGNPVDHDGIGKDGADLGRDHLQCVYCLIAHDVVEPRQHAHVSVSVLGLGTLGSRQTRPRPIRALLLLLADLSHVLTVKQQTQPVYD